MDDEGRGLAGEVEEDGRRGEGAGQDRGDISGRVSDKDNKCHMPRQGWSI